MEQLKRYLNNMKKSYICPITEISEVEILNMICQSPATGEEVLPWDDDYGQGGNGDHNDARCRNDYGQDSDFGSLW